MTTTTGTPVTCTEHDMILHWDQVCAGDLVVDNGDLRGVASVRDDDLPNLVMIVFRDEPHDVALRLREHYTAARRYDTGEG